MRGRPDEPPRGFVVWLTAGALGAGALLALALSQG